MSEPELPPPTSMRLLEIFAAMMGNRTTVATAEALGISQPAVSAGLRQLETQLGLTLFERTGRHLEPTFEARHLYEEIRPLFGILRSFSMRARDLRAGKVGRLRVIATPPPGYSVVPAALRRFLAVRPDVTVSYDVRRLNTVIHAVETGQADIGVGLAEGRIPSVHNEEIGRGQMVALLPGDHPLAAREAIDVREFGAETFIGIERESNLGQLIANIFAAAHAIYHPQLETRYCQTAAALVASGMGLSIVDQWSAQPYLGQAPGADGLHGQAGLVVRPLVHGNEIRCMMFTRRGVPHSQLLKDFMEELRIAGR